MTTHDVTLTRIFDASLTALWRAWTDPELIKAWWGPAGFSCPVADVDLRQGGVTLVAMRAPESMAMRDIYNTWTYTEIVPEQRIEYVFRFTDASGRTVPPIAPGVPEAGRHVVTLEPVGEARTQLTIVEYGYTTEAARDMSLAGLSQCLDKMAALFPSPVWP